MDVITEEGFLEDVLKRAQYFKLKLQKLADKYQTGTEIRGQGFILGWPLDRSGAEIVEGAREKGLLINFVGGKALRFLPPLNVSYQEIDGAITILDQVFAECW